MRRWPSVITLVVTLVALARMAALAAPVVAAVWDESLLAGATGLGWEQHAFDVVSVATVVLLPVPIRTHW